MTTGDVGVVASVANVTAYNVVAVVGLWDVIVWIHTDLCGEKKHMKTINRNLRPQLSVTEWPGFRTRSQGPTVNVSQCSTFYLI